MRELNKLEKELMQEIQSDLLNDRKFQRMLDKKERYTRTFNYAKLASLNNDIQKYQDDKLAEYIEKIERDKISLQKLAELMTPEEKQKTELFSHGMLIFADWIETYSMELNSILNKYVPGGRITLYDNLRKIGRESKNIMGNMQNLASMDYQCDLAEQADKLFVFVDSQLKLQMKKKD